MIREDIAPTEETLSALIRDCATNGGLSRALGMFKELRLFQEISSHQQEQKHKPTTTETTSTNTQQQQQDRPNDERRMIVHKPALGSIFF
jgi:ubiquitin